MFVLCFDLQHANEAWERAVSCVFNSFPWAHTCIHMGTLSHAHTRTHVRTHTHTFSLSLSHTHTHTLSLSLALTALFCSALQQLDTRSRRLASKDWLGLCDETSFTCSAGSSRRPWKTFKIFGECSAALLC